MRPRFMDGAALAWALTGALAAQPAATDHHARPRLIAQTVSATPGGTINLGVTFEIEEGWHLYWNGRNDSGFPPTIEMSLPEGWTAEPAQWPAPVRHAMEGNLLDHVYEHRVTLIIPVHAPASAQPGAKAEVTAHLAWMECDNFCLLADADVALSVPVASVGAALSPDAALFDEARTRMPVPLPEHPKDVTLRWDGDLLNIQSAGAEYVAFYPALEGPALVNPTASGESKSGSLTLAFEWPAGTTAQADAPDSPRVRGILELRRTGAAPVFYGLDLARGRTGGTPQPPSGPTGIR